MGAVAERLFCRSAAAAEGDGRARHDVRHAVPIEDFGSVAIGFDDDRTVLAQPDPDHPIFCIAARNSAFVLVFPILSSRSSIASTGDSGLRILRSTQTRLRSSRLRSSSSLRVPLFSM